MAEEVQDGALPTPPGLSDEWPVAWAPVWGTSDGILDRLMSLAARACLAGMQRLPQPLLEPTLGLCARGAALFDRRHARSARAFLRQALGELPRAELERRVVQSFRHFLRVMVDAERFARLVPFEEILDHYEVNWTDDVRRAVQAKEGCVVVSGHIGDWEAAWRVAPWLGFHPYYGVAKPTRNRPYSIVLQRKREYFGGRLLPRRGAMRDAPAVIRAGGTVGMLLDQRARKNPILAPFFGRPARCDRSAGVLLRRLKVPVVQGACFRTDRPLHYRIEFSEVLWPEELSGSDPVQIATRINRNLERMILAQPDQYHWLHDRYRKTPLAFPEEGGIRPAGSLSSTT